MRILIFDTETGGLDPATCGITQISAGVCDFTPDWSEYEVISTFDALVRPIPHLLYEDKALEIQHRTLDELQNGLPIGKAFQGVHDLVENYFGHSKTCTPYGVNVKFDIDFMDANAKRYNLRMPFNFAYRDICQWFRLLQDLGAHTQHRANLDTILAHYGIEIEEEQRHTAKGDVIATAEAIRFMMKDFKGLRSHKEDTPI
jgi:DNA polymerase III epsilon subunit-like protein